MVNWHWPQWAFFLLLSVSLLLHARDHGKPKTGKDNFWVAIVSIALLNSLLFFGGFWTPR